MVDADQVRLLFDELLNDFRNEASFIIRDRSCSSTEERESAELLEVTIAEYRERLDAILATDT